MLTVLIHGADDPASLALTLVPLVSGAVDGILREVVVLDVRGEDVRRVADHAGCRLAGAADVLAKAGSLKGEWVMLVRAGQRLPDDWIDRTLRHAGAPGARAARLVDPDTRLLRGLFAGPRGAVLAPRAAVAAAAPSVGGRVEALMRALRPRRMRRRG